MSEDIRLPDGWKVLDAGSTALYVEDTDAGPVLRFVRTSDYFGGQNMDGVFRVEDGDLVEVFEELGAPTKARNVLQDRINRWPELPPGGDDE